VFREIGRVAEHERHGERFPLAPHPELG
jgi:hypothetical protein